MNKIFFQVALLLTVTILFTGTVPSRLGNPENYQRFAMPFYAEQVEITYDPGMVISEPVTIDNRSLDQAYRSLKSKPTQVMLNSLLEAKEAYALNDYLFYKLANLTLSVVYQGGQPNARVIAMYGLLNDAGFDARLTFKGDRVFVNVFTSEELFEVPIIDVNNRPYANLNCMDGNCNGKQRLFIHLARPNPTGALFRLSTSYLAQPRSAAGGKKSQVQLPRYRAEPGRNV